MAGGAFIVGVLVGNTEPPMEAQGVGAILLAIIGSFAITQHNNKPDPEHLMAITADR